MKLSFSGAVVATWLCLFGCNHNSSAQTLQFQMRQGDRHPWQSTATPEDQFVQVTAASGWTAKVTGELSTACEGPCLTVKPRIGGAEGEAAVSFTGHGAEILALGVHSSTIDIGSQHWTVRLNVLRRAPYLPFFYRPGYPKGCHNSDKHMPQEDTCVISNEQPAQSLGALKSQGDSFVDPQFGSPVHRLTGEAFSVAYSTVRMFSANSRYVIVADSEAFLHVWEREKNRQLGERFTGSNIAQTVWDPQVEERLWFINGGQVSYRNVLTGAVTMAANYTASRGNRPGLTDMNTGGTADNTDDNWWVFTEPKEKLVCAIDLNGLKPANQEEHLFCDSYGELGLRLVDFAQVTQVDRESKKRYVLLLSEPRSHVLSVNMASRKLDYEYEMPAEITTPHSDVGQDEQGRQVLFWAWYDRWGDKSFAATSLLNKREKMTRPVEEGGGLALLFPIYAGGVRTDAHFGCNWSAYCVMSMYADPVPGGISNWSVTDVRSGTPCVVQVGSNYPFKDGAQVAIGGVGEMSGVNGLSRIKVIDTRTFALEGRTCGGKYELKRGHVAEARQWSPTAPNRDEITVVHLGGEVRRLAIHRTKLWAEHGNLNLYWASPQAGISKDGQYVGFTSNLGLPESNSVFWAEVDLSGEIRKAEIQSRDRDATVRWEGPEEVAIRVSANADMEKTAFAHKYLAGEGREHVIEGLEPDTVYYYQLLGKNSASQGSFRTLKGRGTP